MTKLTEAQFSMQCSYIAKNAAAWAGDTLTLPENYGREANPKTVGRFTDEMRERLDRLDKWAGRLASSETLVRSDNHVSDEEKAVDHDHDQRAYAKQIDEHHASSRYFSDLQYTARSRCPNRIS